MLDGLVSFFGQTAMVPLGSGAMGKKAGGPEKEDPEKKLRIAIVNSDRCKPKKSGTSEPQNQLARNFGITATKTTWTSVHTRVHVIDPFASISRLPQVQAGM